MIEENTPLNLEAMNSVSNIQWYVNHAKKSRNWLENFLKISKYFINQDISGDIVELGAGTACLSGILSQYENVKKITAVEYSPNFVNEIMLSVFNEIEARQDKIDRLVGDFNNLDFPDNSKDFVFEVGAFHHSENIKITVKETYRILKQGGYFIGFDRSHPNKVSEEFIEELMQREISNEQKIRYDFDVNSVITRKDMGEHEYRESEWREFFENEGFEVWMINIFNKHTKKGRIKSFFINPFAKYLLKKKWLKFTLPGMKQKTIIIAQKKRSDI